MTAVANAAPPPARVSGLRCLSEWDANDDYRGEGWVSALVLGDRRSVYLGCGDELSGMIHIAHPESTGTTHPVDAATYGAFASCFQRIVLEGTTAEDRGFEKTRTRYTLFYGHSPTEYALPLTATLIVDNAGRFVWTMYTSTSGSARGNDWDGCARLGAPL